MADRRERASVGTTSGGRIRDAARRGIRPLQSATAHSATAAADTGAVKRLIRVARRIDDGSRRIIWLPSVSRPVGTGFQFF